MVNYVLRSFFFLKKENSLIYLPTCLLVLTLFILLYGPQIFWYYFHFTWRSFFNISWNINLVINSLSLCMKKIFYLKMFYLYFWNVFSVCTVSKINPYFPLRITIICILSHLKFSHSIFIFWVLSFSLFFFFFPLMLLSSSSLNFSTVVPNLLLISSVYFSS